MRLGWRIVVKKRPNFELLRAVRFALIFVQLIDAHCQRTGDSFQCL